MCSTVAELPLKGIRVLELGRQERVGVFVYYDTGSFQGGLGRFGFKQTHESVVAHDDGIFFQFSVPIEHRAPFTGGTGSAHGGRIGGIALLPVMMHATQEETVLGIEGMIASHAHTWVQLLDRIGGPIQCFQGVHDMKVPTAGTGIDGDMA